MHNVIYERPLNGYALEIVNHKSHFESINQIYESSHQCAGTLGAEMYFKKFYFSKDKGFNTYSVSRPLTELLCIFGFLIAKKLLQDGHKNVDRVPKFLLFNLAMHTCKISQVKAI